MNNIEYINKKFGKLTIIEKCGKSSSGHSIFLCKCDCGNEKICKLNELKIGSRKSCGCASFQTISRLTWKLCGEINRSHWTRIKSGAIYHKKEFDITPEYIWGLFQKQNAKCSISGLDLYFAKDYKEFKQGKTTASLDRINSSKGYIKGNVQWVHKMVNYMKQDYSQEYFLNMCKKISDYQRKD